MPTVEKVSGGRVYVHGVGHFDVGDRREVSASDADYLVNERDDFRRVENGETDVSSDSPENATETSSDDSTDERAVSLAGQHWNTAVTAVENGEVDGYLDELERADDRDSVQDAIEERRTELEA